MIKLFSWWKKKPYVDPMSTVGTHNTVYGLIDMSKNPSIIGAQAGKDVAYGVAENKGIGSQAENSDLIGYACQTSSHDNTLIGNYSGYDLTNESHVVIIGDNVHNLDRDQKDVMFIGDKVAIGKKLFGKDLNLQDIIKGEEDASTHPGGE